MQTNFLPKVGDQEIQTFYNSGPQREKQYLRNGIPANGWSRKEYFENGNLKFAECFSHELIIEQVHFDDTGSIISHKIYSHAKKELIDRPVITTIFRHNTVSGVGHMGFYFQHLPAISQFIGAGYDSNELDKAYQEFIKAISEDENLETDDGQFSWGIEGESMGFTIGFEKYEMLYQWSLYTKSEEQYAKARQFMEQLTGKSM